MPQQRQLQKETIPPTMRPPQAIPLLRRQIQRLDEVMKLHHDDPQTVLYKIHIWGTWTIYGAILPENA